MQIPDVPVNTVFTLGGLAMAGVIVYQNLTQTSIVKRTLESMTQQRQADVALQQFTMESLNGNHRRASVTA